VRAKALTYQLGFVVFQRTGMRLLLGNADLGQDVKNGLALDLQLTGQIIDSNLHPVSVPLPVPPGSSVDFTLAYLASRNPLPFQAAILRAAVSTACVLALAKPALTIRKSLRTRHIP
jgi:hypothetical protein